MKNRHKYYNEIIAFAEGRTIQAKYIGIPNEDVWVDDHAPYFDNSKYEFRIKPESKYIPFTFEDREEIRGKWVRRKWINDELVIYNISEEGVNAYTWKEALEALEFLDGTPFGKLVEEGGEE